jgi:hypothetical protein
MENKALFKTDPGGWIHIAPFGEHPHSCGVIQLIDRKACDAMVSAFEARREKEGEVFAGVLLDYDHFSMDTDKPSEAAGWIVELVTRDDGLWGKVRWTDTGLKAVEGGRYRLVSAVFPRVEELEVVDAKLNKRRPLELRSCALTNEPNIKGGKPIANRKLGFRSEDLGVGDWGEVSLEGTKSTEGNLSQDYRIGEEVSGQLSAVSSQSGDKGRQAIGNRQPDGTENRETAGIPGVAVGGEDAKRYMWILGETKSGTHCPACMERHGKVKTLLEWMRLPAPPCRCACHLAEVGVDVKEGYKPPVPPKPDRGTVKNRIARVERLLLRREVSGLCNRWSNAARLASIAARLAKYGYMMGLQPWGDSARAAAAASRKSKRPSLLDEFVSGSAYIEEEEKPKKTSSARSSSSGGGSKPRAKKTSAVDKSNDVCFHCGKKGHWAYECPLKADKARMQAKIDAGIERYKRVLDLPERPGGYRQDGSPAIPDMTGSLAEWSRTSRADGTPVLADAEPYDRLREAAEKDFQEWLSGVDDAEEKIETFNALVAALGGATAAAAGAPDPTGGATWAFGASLGAAAGKKPFAKTVEAYMRLGKKPPNPYEMFGSGYDAAKDPPGLDGLTQREKILAAVKTRDKAITLWYQALDGTPGEGSKHPSDPEILFNVLPKVTGVPDIVQLITEMSKQDVLKSRARLRRTVEEEAGLRKTYIDDILRTDPQARRVHDMRHLDTRFLRMWAERVTGRGIYGQTGAMSPEVMSGKFTENHPEGGGLKHQKIPVPMPVMKKTIKKYLPEVPEDVAEWSPPTVMYKLYKRAIKRSQEVRAPAGP